MDAGTLSDSWRSEPNTLVYCKPYMPTIPKGMSMEDTAAWIFIPGPKLVANKQLSLFID